MDYSGRAIKPFHLLFILLIAAGCAEQRIDSSPVQLPEQIRWAPDNVDLVELLTHEPAECLKSSVDQSITLGRLDFRSPYLLGG